MKLIHRTLVISAIVILHFLALVFMFVPIKVTRYLKDTEIEFDQQVELMKKAAERDGKQP